VFRLFFPLDMTAEVSHSVEHMLGAPS
jgi:hypothetical protein